MKPKSTSIATLAALTFTTMAAAANWPHWRGPAYNGSSPEVNLPDTFSKTENVKWVVDLPGPSAATPIIWGDTVLVSTIDDQAQVLFAMALDRKTGRQLWKQETGVGIRKDRRSNYASPSPATDGQRAYFFYGNGELIAFDMEGNKAWSQNLQKEYGEFAFQWTFSTSPTIVDGKLYMQVLQRDVPVNGAGRTDGPNDSYLLALDSASGKVLWRVVRPSKARAESLEAFTTPVPEGDQLLVAGGDCLTGHDLATGKELWRWGTWNPERIGHWRLVPSPVAGEGVVLGCGPKQAPVFAIKMEGRGTLPDSNIAWTSAQPEISSDVATPLFYKDHFFILNGDRDFIAKVDPTTGKAVWIGSFGQRVKIESSPTGADGRVYVMNFRGEVFVLEAGEEFKVLHTARMGDDGDNEIRASIAVSQGNLFIRTASKLYCIGK